MCEFKRNKSLLISLFLYCNLITPIYCYILNENNDDKYAFVFQKWK